MMDSEMGGACQSRCSRACEVRAAETRSTHGARCDATSCPKYRVRG